MAKKRASSKVDSGLYSTLFERLALVDTARTIKNGLVIENEEHLKTEHERE
jgi:hypothetical protein